MPRKSTVQDLKEDLPGMYEDLIKEANGEYVDPDKTYSGRNYTRAEFKVDCPELASEIFISARAQRVADKAASVRAAKAEEKTEEDEWLERMSKKGKLSFPDKNPHLKKPTLIERKNKPKRNLVGPGDTTFYGADVEEAVAAGALDDDQWLEDMRHKAYGRYK